MSPLWVWPLNSAGGLASPFPRVGCDGVEARVADSKMARPTFAWEVLEVYSPPPVVSFRWRHWGVMKSDYVGYNK